MTLALTWNARSWTSFPQPTRTQHASRLLRVREALYAEQERLARDFNKAEDADNEAEMERIVSRQLDVEAAIEFAESAL